MKPQTSVLKYPHSFFKPTRMSTRLPCSGGAGHLSHASCLQALRGLGMWGQDKPWSNNKNMGLSRKQSDGMAPALPEAETQPQLDAFLRLSGHHREAVASRA